MLNPSSACASWPSVGSAPWWLTQMAGTVTKCFPEDEDDSASGVWLVSGPDGCQSTPWVGEG